MLYRSNTVNLYHDIHDCCEVLIKTMENVKSEFIKKSKEVGVKCVNTRATLKQVILRNESLGLLTKKGARAGCVGVYPTRGIDYPPIKLVIKTLVE